MLVDFLFELRKDGLKVSSHEWLALMEAMDLGLHDSSLDGFYRLARTVCVKESPTTTPSIARSRAPSPGSPRPRWR